MTGRRPQPLRRRPRPTLGLGLAVTLAALMVLAPAPPAAARHANGDKVEVTGVVTSADGKPLAGVQVVLEAARSRFSMRRFQREEVNPSRIATLTDERGQYTLEWPWNNYYNTFELAVGVPVRKPDGERFHALERVDVTRQLKKTSPVVVAVVVENAEFVASLRRFLDGISSDDERRVYREMGKPDKVDERVYQDGSGRKDATWWYFEAGRAYRFRAGVLTDVERFDPVKDF